MKKKIVAILCSALLGVIGAFALTGCESSDNVTQKVSKQEAYALSAVSSMSYLAASGTTSSAMFAAANASDESAPALSRPESLTDEDVAGIKDCLIMFDDMAGGGVTEAVSKNTDEGEFAEYSFVMTVSVAGMPEMKMYYDEVYTETETEVEDGEEETESSTRLEGVMAVGDNRFDVCGEREVEIEGEEIETSIEFTTRSRSNPLDYVKVSQSTENEETEYEYEIYLNGKKVRTIEVEYERKNSKTVFEFSIKDKAESQNTKYKMEKKEGTDETVIIFIARGEEDKFTAVQVGGSYEFTYSNGFKETV